MPFSLGDAIYDRTHTWQNTQDRVEFERAFTSGRPAEIRMAVACLTADPLTSEDEIRELLCQPALPPRYGYDDSAMTIDDVFSISETRDAAVTDFSGGKGSYTGSDRNSIIY